MAVLPSHHAVDLERLGAALGGADVVLASEDEFRGLCPDCEEGAIPPFGNLYGMEVFADEALTKDAQIAFNAGSHTELLQLDYADFERLAKPKVANFSR